MAQPRLAGIAVHVMVAWLAAAAGTPARATDDVEQLKTRTRELHNARKDDAALEGMERLVRVVERDRAHDTELTVSSICSMGYYALCARQPRKALAACDRGLKLNPDHPLCHLNRAHALLFLGRADEARAIYLGHKGERANGHRGELLEVLVAQDFRELRERGLDHPKMADIQRALEKAPCSPRARAAEGLAAKGTSDMEEAARAQMQLYRAKQRMNIELQGIKAAEELTRPTKSDYDSWRH